MPYNTRLDGISAFLLDQTSRTQHAIGSLTATVAGMDRRVEEMRKDILDRLDKQAQHQQKAPPSWIKDLPTGQIISIVMLILGGLVLHLSPEEWKAILLAKFGGK